MATLDSVLHEGLLINRKWFKEQSIKGTAVDYYLRSGKLEAVLNGLYRKPGPPLKWQNVVHSLTVLGYETHIGHITALEYHGYKQYISLGEEGQIRLYSPHSLPSWVTRINIYPGFILMRRNPFDDSTLGLIDVPFGTWDWPIKYSTPERAFIESASTIEAEEDIVRAVEMLEGAANLRPRVIQTLLEACSSIKGKRLFLWLARNANHSWYQHIDITSIDLGTGNRQIIAGGVLDKQFLITVPRGMEHGQEEPLF